MSDFTFEMPIDEETWELIGNADFAQTEKVWFQNKHGISAEFAKVRHGHWEFEGWNTYTCSSCGAVYGTEQLTALQQYTTDPAFPRYCPNCGSRNVVETWNVPDWRKKDDER